MAETYFDYQGALDAGHTQEDIFNYMKERNPDFDADAAHKSGYSLEEINKHLATRKKGEKKPEMSGGEKALRVGEQYALGVAQGSPSGIVYDIATAPLASEEAQMVPYRENLMDEIESLAFQKQTGVWSDEDQKHLDQLTSQLKDTSKSKEFIKTADISIRGLAEKATGQNLHPEGFLEKAANWAGFIKDPKKLMEIGLKPVELTKALLPEVKEGLRGAGAGLGLQMAEEGKFGPLGTLAFAVGGDLLGGGVGAVGKAIVNPKQTAANIVNLATMNNTRKQIAQSLADDFTASGLTLDAGTLTQSPLVQMMQARLTQSGLTGDALENFRKELSNQVTREYKNILGDLGEITFENNYQASEAIKNALKVEERALNTIPSRTLAEQQKSAKSLEGRVATEAADQYEQRFLDSIAPSEAKSTAQKGETLKTAAEDLKTGIKEEIDTRWSDLNQEIGQIEAGPQAQLADRLSTFIRNNEGSLLLGESAAEARVIQSAQKLLDTIRMEDGALRGVTLDSLIKTKRTLADIANWEFGGSNFESAYKNMVGELNAAIDRTLADNPELRNQYLTLNADTEHYKSLFENKNVQKLFEPKNQNYNSLYNEFSTNPDKLRSLEDIAWNDPRGIEIVNEVKRDYAQKVISGDLTPQKALDLTHLLGEEHAPQILEYLASRERAAQQKLPRAAQQSSLGITAEAPQTKPTRVEPIKASETGTERAREGVRKKMLESMKNNKGEFKSGEEIMKQMDTVKGIKELKRALETTPEGKELFKELSRYKLADLIDRKMSDSVTDQVKLGKFSKLLESQKSKDIVKELVGESAYNKLELLQKNSGKLAESAAKFFNASKSGTTAVDVGVLGSALTGLLTGNPFIAVPAFTTMGGSYILANLLADPVFLKELEKAIRSPKGDAFEFLTKWMKGSLRASKKERDDQAS